MNQQGPTDYASGEADARPRHCWRRRAVRLLLTLAILYVGVLVLLTLFQSRFVYYPRAEHEGTPEEYGLAFENVALTTADGVGLHGWWVPAADARYTLLLLHGNAGNVSHRTDLLSLLHGQGCNVLIIDYRGYGHSQGKPTEDGTYEDALTAWRYLVDDRGIAPDRIIIHGRSLGGAIATWLATQVQAGGLIVESSFTSAPDMGASVLPIFPRFLIRFRYNSIDRIAAIDMPLMVIHSQDDDLVPYEQGRRLFEAAREPKRFVELDGGHNDAYLLSVNRYKAALDAFITDVIE
jgi:hypothetical protein